MSLTKDDLYNIKSLIVETVQPMFDTQSRLFDKKLDTQSRLFDKKLDTQSGLFDKKLDTQSGLFDKKLDTQSGLFDKKLDAQSGLLDEKLRAQRSALMLDMRAMLREELQGIKADLDRLKNREDNHIRGLYEDFDKLRSEFKALESRFTKFEKLKSRS